MPTENRGHKLDTERLKAPVSVTRTLPILAILRDEESLK
jgi:hypothetical protein